MGADFNQSEEIFQHFIVDEELWKTLQKADPETISLNCEVTFDPKRGWYLIPVLDEVYGVCLKDKKIIKLSEGDASQEKFRVELTLFLLHYLLGTKNIPLAGKRISEKELKGGEMFFRGPHALSTQGIIKKFGNNPEGFIAAGLKLKGEKVNLGDAAIELKAAPKVSITYVLWIEDEEFPASVKILFDPTIQQFLPLDIIYGLTIFTSHRLAHPSFP
ncbi:MAG TPA: DUF3786 domain-containing protein [Thermodesulfobacteriota bacterium]|nr:DUF3786 domain-containing protein [Thermodesulfobacteriota bacterium]